MEILLTRVPEAKYRGIYPTPNGNKLSKRMLYLHPAAYQSLFVQSVLGKKLWYSDIYRPAEASLLARRRKRGVQRPGYSGHNYGLSVDLAVAKVLKQLGWNKEKLDQEMEALGWYCHRIDHKLLRESWHYNYLGKKEESKQYFIMSKRTTAHAIENKIQAVYGAYFQVEKKAVQEKLKELRLYQGEIDGIHGPLTREALSIFQRAWDLPDTGKLTKKTQRIIAFITAQKKVLSTVSFVSPAT